MAVSIYRIAIFRWEDARVKYDFHKNFVREYSVKNSVNRVHVSSWCSLFEKIDQQTKSVFFYH